MTDSSIRQPLTFKNSSIINYAFVDIKNNRAWLHNEVTDTVNFRELTELKKINPQLKILISIGGWGWSKHFSDAVLSDSSRKEFVASAVAIVQKYDLDGIDIDWEYPAMLGDNNVFRPEDRHNYTLLFQEMRNQLNQLQLQTNKKYLITAAVGAAHSFIEHTEMNQVQQYLDEVNLMTYDYKTEVDSLAGHHTNLYASRFDPDRQSADATIRDYLSNGVPAEKIVMGIAFYGHSWKVKNDLHHGRYQPVDSATGGAGYSKIKDTIANETGNKKYWDHKAKAPYLFNENTKMFFSYDDERSVKYKCNYIKKYHLAGAMFWEYFADPREYLLTEINKDLQ